jgi:two-component sensor histidine kinase
VVFGVTQYQVDRSRHAEIEDLAVQSARQAAFELDRIIGGVRVLLIAVSKVPDVRDVNEAGCTAYFDRLRPELPYLTGLAVLTADGRRRCGYAQSAAEKDGFTKQSYFHDALATEAAVVGEYISGPSSDHPVVPVAMAMRDADGAAGGVLVAFLDLVWLGERLKERGLPPGGSVTVSDRSGVIIAREPLPAFFVGTKIPDPYMRLLTAPRPGWEEVLSQDGTRRVLGYVPLSESPTGLYVSAGLSAERSYETVNAAARVGAMLTIAGTLATLLATWTMGDRVFVQPIQRVTDVLRKWRAGDRTARTRYVAANGEIGQLGAELDRLMDEICRGQEQQELLAQELEHRVKNTLATVQALAAMTLNRQATGKELLPDFLARIAALASAHEVLTHRQWDSADLRELLLKALRPLVDDVERRVRIDGINIELPARAALA